MSIVGRIEQLAEQKPLAVVYDLDGTVVDSTERILKYLDLDAKARGDHDAYRESYKGYAATTETDKVILDGVYVVNALCWIHCAVPVALTSRSEDSREPTLEFLQMEMPWSVSNDLLYMRPERRDDPTDFLWKASHAEVKSWALDKIEERFQVVAVVEDNPAVCEMVKQRGIMAVLLGHPGVNCLNPKNDARLMP